MNLLLANGEFPATEKTRNLLRTAEHVVCCDGAAEALLDFGRVPDAVVGDLDSISAAAREKLVGRIYPESEQETCDLQKAFRFCRRQGWLEELCLLGCTGRREDHTLANISLLAQFAPEAPGIRMITDHGCFLALSRSGSISVRPGQQLSLFPLPSRFPVFSCGLKWELQGLVPEFWWQASLNEALQDSVHFSFPDSCTLLVYLADVL